jgi:hypothetical protein
VVWAATIRVVPSGGDLAGAVVHQHRPERAVGQLLGHDAGDDVVAAAGREAHQDPGRPPGLRQGRPAGCDQGCLPKQVAAG